MMRDPVVARSSQATALGCDEARQWLSALLAGRTGLTERALVEAHLSQCPDCRQEEARLRQVVTARRVTPPRALLDYLGKAMAVTRTGVIRSAALAVRLRSLPTPALKFTPSAVAGVIQAARLGIGHSADLIARLRAVLAIALTVWARASARVIQVIILGIDQSLDLIARLRAVPAAALTLTARAIAGMIQATDRSITRCVASIAQLHVSLAIRFKSSVRATANVIAAIGFGITHFAKRVVQLRSLPAIPLMTYLRAVGIVLVLALMAYALQWTTRPQQPARATASSGARVDPTQVVSFLPLPPVTPSLEPNSAVPAAPRTERPRQSPPGAAALSTQRASVREAAREAPAPPVSVPEYVAPVMDVVGRLSARDWTAAERDFTALLAGVGGTELGRHRRAAFAAVEVVVPRSRYDDFARGLTRIGSWQLEAARSPLPDVVHMTIRVSE